MYHRHVVAAATQHGMTTFSVALMPDDSFVIGPVRLQAVGRLEPCAGKLACTVLWGEHAGNGVLLPEGKAKKSYEFGVKSAVVVSHEHGLMLGARTFPGCPYDPVNGSIRTTRKIDPDA